MQPTTDGPKKLIALGINSEGNFYMAFLGLAKSRIILGAFKSLKSRNYQKKRKVENQNLNLGSIGANSRLW